MKNEIEIVRTRLFARELMGISSDDDYVNWAVNELMNGNETDSIKIIAGLEKPINYFDLMDAVKKTKIELKIEIDQKSILEDYVMNLAMQKLDNKIESKDIVNEINSILVYTEYDKRYSIWLNIVEFYDDYYILNDGNVEDAIVRACKIVLEENGNDYFPELHD